MSATKSMHDNELERRVDYYRRQLDSVAGENLRKDYEISGLRKEILHRQRAFALLSKLQAEIGAQQDVGEILRTVMTTITASLGMDRTVVFKPGDAEHEFQPWMWTGFAEEGRLEEFERHLGGLSLSVPELRLRSDTLLANRDAPPHPIDRGVENHAGDPVLRRGPHCGGRPAHRAAAVG